MTPRKRIDPSGKAPAYQCYPDKFIVDTRRLSWEAKGIYRELIDIIWMQFQDTCSIPHDDDFIASELGCEKSLWCTAKVEILHNLRPLLVQTETGRLFSKGLWKCKQNLIDRREQARLNGLRGGRPKKPKNQSLSERKAKKSSPTVTPSPIVTVFPPVAPPAERGVKEADPQLPGEEKGTPRGTAAAPEKDPGEETPEPVVEPVQ